MIQGIAPDVTIAPVGVFDRVAQALGSTDISERRRRVRRARRAPRSARDHARAARRADARGHPGRLRRGSRPAGSTGASSRSRAPRRSACRTRSTRRRSSGRWGWPTRSRRPRRRRPVWPRSCARIRSRTVRALALQALCGPGADHPVAQEALQHASRDPDPSVRLQAGRALGPRGEALLRALASDAAVPDAVSAEAIDALGDGVHAGGRPRGPAARDRVGAWVAPRGPRCALSRPAVRRRCRRSRRRWRPSPWSRRRRPARSGGSPARTRSRRCTKRRPAAGTFAAPRARRSPPSSRGSRARRPGRSRSPTGDGRAGVGRRLGRGTCVASGGRVAGAASRPRARARPRSARARPRSRRGRASRSRRSASS